MPAARIPLPLPATGAEPVPTPADLTAKTQEYKGKNVEVVYSRSGVEASSEVSLRGDNEDKKGYLGIGSGQRESIRLKQVQKVLLKYQKSVPSILQIAELAVNILQYGKLEAQ